MPSRMEILRTWDHRTQVNSPTHRSLRQAFVELDVLKYKLQLPNVVVEKVQNISFGPWRVCKKIKSRMNG
jgi:transcription initiation factor TFIIIB Brf1 subunit/transcription initiation factor TFIIB